MSPRGVKFDMEAPKPENKTEKRLTDDDREWHMCVLCMCLLCVLCTTNELHGLFVQTQIYTFLDERTCVSDQNQQSMRDSIGIPHQQSLTRSATLQP